MKVLMAEPLILVINPGSTGTKVAVFAGDVEQAREELPHADKETRLRPLMEQLDDRLRAVRRWLDEQGWQLSAFAAVVGRGGLLRPVSGGTYRVDALMLEDLRRGVGGQHPANLGGIMSHELARQAGCSAFVVDPVSVDEMEPVARISGLPLIRRRSLFHVLNVKSAYRRACRELGLVPSEARMVVVHLGGGISVCAVRGGRVVDVNNANEQGPFGPNRAGGLPAVSLVQLCYAGRWSREEMLTMLTARGGLMAYLGTDDARQVEAMVASGHHRARLVYQAMAYQVAKEIGAMAAALGGGLNAVVLTGGLARSDMFVDWVRERIAFLGQVLVYPGEREMEALAAGALRVLRGEARAKSYAAEVRSRELAGRDTGTC